MYCYHRMPHNYCIPMCIYRLYFGEHNVPGMFAILEPLHQKMENGPETLKEISFNHVRSISLSLSLSPLHSSFSLVFSFAILKMGYVYTWRLNILCKPQAYGRDLAEAYEWCKKYKYTNNVKDLTQAWELYYHVFRRISKQLPQVNRESIQVYAWYFFYDTYVFQ